MNKIGFALESAPVNVITEYLSLHPEPRRHLVLQDMRDSVEVKLGWPVPRILQAGSPEIGNDEYLIRWNYERLSQTRQQQRLRARRDGSIFFERSLLWDGTQRPAFDGDGFDGYVERVISNCLRGVNFVCTPCDCTPTTAVQISISVRGLGGSEMIFNPPRERFNTVCRSSEAIERDEIVLLSSQSGLLESLRKATFNISNCVLNTFQLPKYFDYISDDEFTVLFEKEVARLKFTEGILASLH
ncbi:MAG: hypothetical protein DMG27_18495 [Acidobacteria bacterium]|nr:MAG: hypothetical protein DMG27_18495 [Acidobacteriota bacterium]